VSNIPDTGPWKRIERIGNAVLLLGDCLEILPVLPKVDAVITDPPYGLARDGWDDSLVKMKLSEWAKSWLSVAPYAMFTFHARVWELGDYMRDIATIWRVLIWHKPFVLAGNLANFKWHWEPIVWIGPTGSKPPSKPYVIPDVFTVFPVATKMHPESVGHNSQKPLQLLRELIEPQRDAQIILDPFMGSGTTGVACAQLGRSFIGIEIEPKYYEIACERITNAYRQEPLFDAYDEVTRSYEQVSLL